MLIEKFIFNILAFSLFIIIFSKLIRKNDTNYVVILVIEAIGIAINFLELLIGGIFATVISKILMYIMAIILPTIVILIEYSGNNFSEIISILEAKFLILIGDKKAAKTILINMMEKYPDSYYRIAELLNDLDKKDEAITMLQNLLQNKPEYYKASTLLGELLYSQERFKEAVTVYQDALKYKPADFELYYSLGMVYTRLNDFSSAKECYEKAAEINHRLYNSKYNLGQIALIEKDLEAAEEYFAECLMSEELEAKAYYQLAKIYMVKGEKDKAIVFANKAIEIDESYLKIISKENIFEPIKQYLTVKVKMEEKEVKKQNPKDLEIQNYLEETLYLIKDMNENEIKNRVSKHVDEIFEQEELKKMQEERLQEDENTEEKVK